eukprot:gnl/Chilomastix_cuspidata/439.p2 GENE.gnl/Chilomastix_cuspidata/439~~gnl/Chilomastix_cuspidata/439.p2  ORF type:complete len:531 (-),score=189.41 gnl/Chilomastix_cuspidata/439:4200-5792(-)
MQSAIITPVALFTLWVFAYAMINIFDKDNDQAIANSLRRKGFDIGIAGFTYTRQNVSLKRDQPIKQQKSRKILQKCALPITLISMIVVIAIIIAAGVLAWIPRPDGSARQIIKVLPSSYMSGISPFVALFLVGACHELGHVVAGKIVGQPHTGWGISLKFGIPGFFILTEEVSSTATSRAVLLFGGIAGNVVLALAAIVLSLFAPMLCGIFAERGAGLTIADIATTATAFAPEPWYAPQDIHRGDVLVSMGSCPTTDAYDFFRCADKLSSSVARSVPIIFEDLELRRTGVEQMNSEGMGQQVLAGGVCVRGAPRAVTLPDDWSDVAPTERFSFIPVEYSIFGDRGDYVVTALRPVRFDPGELEAAAHTLKRVSLCTANCSDALPCVFPPQPLPDSTEDFAVFLEISVRRGRKQFKHLIYAPVERISELFQLQEWAARPKIPGPFRRFFALLEYRLTSFLETVLLLSAGMALFNWAPLGARGDGARYFATIYEWLRGKLLLRFLWFGARVAAYVGFGAFVTGTLLRAAGLL